MIETTKIRKCLKEFFEKEDVKIKNSSIVIQTQQTKDSDGVVIENYMITFNRRVADTRPIYAIRPGTTIKISGVDFIVLKHTDNNSLIITKDIIFNSSFGESNNFNESNIPALCCNNLKLKDFIEENEDILVPLAVDTKAEDGMTYNGKMMFKKFGLLTLDDYRDFRTFLQPLGSSWWLATPVTYTENFNNIILMVDSDGIIGSENCAYDRIGVRPICILPSKVVAEVVK